MRLWFDDLYLFIYLVVLDFVRAWMYVIIIYYFLIRVHSGRVKSGQVKSGRIK